jgi:hypothetical protein
MHYELRYQAKMHEISEKLSREKKKKNSASSSPIIFFIFFLLKNVTKLKKKQQHAYGKGNDIYSQHVR